MYFYHIVIMYQIKRKINWKSLRNGYSNSCTCTILRLQIGNAKNIFSLGVKSAAIMWCDLCGKRICATQLFLFMFEIT